jgi:hypothetical protein
MQLHVNERPSSLSLNAVVVGALIGLIVDLGFTLLGTGLGLGNIEADPVDGIGAGTYALIGLFTAAAMAISFTAAGYVAARSSPATQRWDAAVHGLAAFALAALTMVFVIGSSAGLGVGGVLTRLGLGPVAVSFVALSLLVLGALASGLGSFLGLRGAYRAARRRGENVSRVEDLAA